MHENIGTKSAQHESVKDQTQRKSLQIDLLNHTADMCESDEGVQTVVHEQI